MTTDTMSAAMWLYLLKSGATMNAAALARVLGRDRKLTDKLMSSMASRGTVRASHDPARKDGRAYSVDAACSIPLGVTPGKVLAALNLQDAMPEPPKVEAKPKDSLRPGIGRVSSVFALGCLETPTPRAHARISEGS